MLRKNGTRGKLGLRLLPVVLILVGIITLLGGFDLKDEEKDDKDREETKLGKCVACDPPEIYDIFHTRKQVWIYLMTYEQVKSGSIQREVALSYFAGLVRDYELGYPASGYAIPLIQSDFIPVDDRRCWGFRSHLVLDTPYTPGREVGIALRKVDEPASYQKEGDQDCPMDVPSTPGDEIEIDEWVKDDIMERFERCHSVHHMDWRECHYRPALSPPETPMIKPAHIYVEGVHYDVCVEVSDVTIGSLYLRASYEADELSMDFILRTPMPATWSTALILTEPAVQVIPLWTTSISEIDTFIEESIILPFPVPGGGWLGIRSILFSESGLLASDLVWVEAK